MKKLLFVWTVFVLFHAILFGQDKDIEDSKDNKELIIKSIQSKDNHMVTFIEKKLTDSIAKMFSPNSHLIPEYGDIIESRDDISKYFSSLFKSGLKVTSLKFDPIELRVYGDIVLEIGTVDVKYSTSSNPIEVKKKYNYLINWKSSKKGNYRIRVATWNSLKPCE
jgi:ketosteroid isomerase-like protein